MQDQKNTQEKLNRLKVHTHRDTHTIDGVRVQYCRGTEVLKTGTVVIRPYQILSTVLVELVLALLERVWYSYVRAYSTRQYCADDKASDTDMIQWYQVIVRTSVPRYGGGSSACFEEPRRNQSCSYKNTLQRLHHLTYLRS